MPRSKSATGILQPLRNVHDAVKRSNVLELEAMVKRGASINEIDSTSKDRFTPVHWACSAGSLECLHWLLWHGCDSSMVTSQGWTPAHIAAIKGQDACIQALANGGANMSACDQRRCTPAHMAAAHGNSSTLTSILRSGTDIEVQDKNGWSPVHHAAFHGRLGCMQILVKWGARFEETDNSGNTPAHLSAMEGHLPCLKFLVSYGPSVTTVLNSRNDNGDTPKNLASQFYKQNCVDYINAVEWERDHPEEKENLSFPAHVAALQGDLGHLRMLIEQGVVNINEKDDKGSTPAHKAAGNGHLNCLQWLVEMGANVHISNNAGETARDVAIRYAQLAAVKLLGEEDSDSDYEGQADYAQGSDKDDNDEKETRRVQRHADHGGDEGESVMTPKQRQEARGRAMKRIEELERMVDLAKKNYVQLGGRLDEDREEIKKERESERVIEEMEAQLEYERVRREKLEAQLDESSAEITHLNKKLLESRRANAREAQQQQDSTSVYTSDDDQLRVKKKTGSGAKKSKRPKSAATITTTSSSTPQPAKRNVSFKPSAKKTTEDFAKIF